MRPVLAILTVMWLAVGMTSCSTRKNTAANRQYQAFITRYNIYFNGDEHFHETLGEMEKKYQDDYTTLLPMHPVEASGQPGSAFDRSIEKARKAIQLRSIRRRPQRKPGHSRDSEYREWMKREEYNPFLHNAWMMLARSQYFNADFATAASTFMYVAKHFKWLPATVTEAKLWQARCYCALGWLYEAEMILTRVSEVDLTNRNIAGLYYFTWADMLIRNSDYSAAIPYLDKATEYASGPQKQRLGFLLGQLYALDGQNGKAYDQFRRIARSGAADRSMRLNARVRQSEVYRGSDVAAEIKALRRMTRYSSNSDYLDQLYYAIANLQLAAGDTAQAMAGYSEAIARSTRSGIDQAIARLALGNLYFGRGRYDLAQPCYAAAVPVLPESYPGYDSIRHRSDVLDELAVYSRNVVLQDSLLRLADMSPAERLAVVEQIISRLKRAEKEEAEARRQSEAETGMPTAPQPAAGNAAKAPTAFALNTDNSWYFYNQSVRDAGRTEFQRRWGNRRLEDDWRRSNKNSFAATDIGTDGDMANRDTDSDTDNDNRDTDNETRKRQSDPHFPEYYLAQIPDTELQRTRANEVIEGGLFNMGLILKDKLEDYPAAASTLQQLLSRYPDSQYRLEAYYCLYMMNIREGREAEAERYRRLIVADFPESPYGEAMANRNYYRNLIDMLHTQDSLYQAAYTMYLANRNDAVHATVRQAREKYPMSELMPKFMFLDALAYATDNDRERFAEGLKELVERYPEADVSPVAASYISQLSSGRRLHSSSGNVRGMLRNISLANDSVMQVDGDETLHLDLDPEAPHMLVLMFSTDSVPANELLFEVARHNFATFMTRDFDLEAMRFGELGLLLIKGFYNQADLNRYRTLSEKAGFTLPQGVTPVMISETNFAALLAAGRSFDDYFRTLERLATDRTHTDVLPADQYPSQDEMYGSDNDISNPDTH